MMLPKLSLSLNLPHKMAAKRPEAIAVTAKIKLIENVGIINFLMHVSAC